MHTRWNADARADPAVPRAAPRVEVRDMLYEGVPSFDASDSTLRPGLQSDALMNHSLGLVRNWTRWIAEGAQRSVSQKDLDTTWSHWVDEDKALSPKFLSQQKSIRSGRPRRRSGREASACYSAKKKNRCVTVEPRPIWNRSNLKRERE